MKNASSVLYFTVTSVMTFIRSEMKKDLSSGIKNSVGRGGGTETFERKYIFHKKA